MPHTVRRLLAVSAGSAALVAGVLTGTAGIALADGHHGHDAHPVGGSSHHPDGTGSGLSGGPTHTQVLPGGDADVPLQDPTLGEGTVLPPAYNALAAPTG
jgi:hypothetical protein